MKTIDEALDIVLDATRTLGEEEVPLFEALRRVASRSVLSPIDIPPFSCSAMDGYAVRGRDLDHDGLTFEVVDEVPAGTVSSVAVGAGCAAKIMTGAQLPSGADTVVPVKLTKPGASDVRVGGRVCVVRALEPGANVRRAGDGLARGSSVLGPGQGLSPAHLGLLASLGLGAVAVTVRPRVAILATGSELVALGEPCGPGQINDANSIAAYGQVLEAGAEPLLLGIARDDRDELRRLLKTALEADVVITSGGVSVGELDYVKEIQEDLGVETRFWGVKAKPGWPLTFGVCGETLVFGVPGNPVAAMVSFELFIRPALHAMQARRDLFRPCVRATSRDALKATKERVELTRCRLFREGGGFSFARAGSQGSGVLHSMALADGLALVPAGHPGSEPGAEFGVLLLEGASSERPPFPN